MTYTTENPNADGSAAPGARPRYRPPRHRDLYATSRTHDNWMAARQTSCRQQTAPPQPRCSKDVTTHPHRPGARPGRSCPVPACSGQPPSGRSEFQGGRGGGKEGGRLGGREEGREGARERERREAMGIKKLDQTRQNIIAVFISRSLASLSVFVHVRLFFRMQCLPASACCLCVRLQHRRDFSSSVS
jgi:hypothetical protein